MTNITIAHHEAGAALLPMVVTVTIWAWRQFRVTIKSRKIGERR